MCEPYSIDGLDAILCLCDNRRMERDDWPVHQPAAPITGLCASPTMLDGHSDAWLYPADWRDAQPFQVGPHACTCGHEAEEHDRDGECQIRLCSCEHYEMEVTDDA